MLTQKINRWVEATLLSKPNNKISSHSRYTTYTSKIVVEYKLFFLKFKKTKILKHRISHQLKGELCQHQQLLQEGDECSLCKHHSTHHTVFDALFFLGRGKYVQTNPDRWYRLVEIGWRGITVTQLPWSDESVRKILHRTKHYRPVPITNDFAPSRAEDLKGTEKLFCG